MPSKDRNWRETRRRAKRGEEIVREYRLVDKPPIGLPDFSTRIGAGNTIIGRAKRSSMNRKVKVTLAERA